MNHADKKNQDQSYFQQLAENVKRQRLDKTGLFHQKGAEIVKALNEVALLVAKSMKAHTIAESLIMPAAKILVRRVMGEESVVKLESVSVPIIRPGTLDRRSKDWARLTGNTQDRRNVRPAVHNTVRNNDEKYYFLTRPPFIFLRSQPWWTTFSF